MFRSALLLGLGLLAAPRGAEAQGLRTLTYQGQTGCTGNNLTAPIVSSPCITAGYYIIYDANGNILGTSQTESEALHCEDFGLIGTVNSNTSTGTAGTLLLFDHEGDNYTATYTANTYTLRPAFAPACSFTFTTTTTTTIPSTFGGRMGTLSYVGAVPTTCPADTCATAGYYYVYDGHEGLGLVPLSTNTSDGCAVLGAHMGANANAAGGTFEVEWAASNSFDELIVEVEGGIVGNYNAAGNSFTMTVATADMASALGVNTGCQYKYSFTSGPGYNFTVPKKSAAVAASSSSAAVVLSAALVAVYAALL